MIWSIRIPTNGSHRHQSKCREAGESAGLACVRAAPLRGDASREVPRYSVLTAQRTELRFRACTSSAGGGGCSREAAATGRSVEVEVLRWLLLEPQAVVL